MTAQQPNKQIMRRPSKDHPKKLSADSQRLMNFAQALTQAASRLEERNWEQSLNNQIQKLLKHNHQDQIDQALAHLFQTDLNSYDALMEAVEACSETYQLEIDEKGEKQSYDALLVTAPILAWTRFSIQSGPIAPEIAQTLSSAFHSLLADDTKMALMPSLYSIDQLPRNHCETHHLIQRMGLAAIKQNHLRPPAKPAETAPFLADTRYLLIAVAAKHGAPLFRWQMPTEQANYAENLEQSLTRWRTEATAALTLLLPGCGVELLLPEAYFVGCREADKMVRPVTIRAAVHYLTQTLSLKPEQLRAIVAPFSEEIDGEQTDEYRIGFTLTKQSDIIYGIVWPLYGLEDEELPDIGAVIAGKPEQLKKAIDEILELLTEVGITEIQRYNEHFPLEYCDDCGAPLFVDTDGELIHAEMPENMPEGNAHFH